ncbi:hypothetical protein RFI_04222 [Reticulomyxa filosa]|uniref:Hypoxanthine phosphoribosyltransferase n=1 Tax=Reticulomyxa filosa TaxID=46433 RepID=X6P4A9_RETFI|nr:hypothetical protein RFI_04222 [Reticulomyxa filosa]|eukprot:ETO32899.1 hypothetical protein RFI_04222 [Reticulomyxa filosa]
MSIDLFFFLEEQFLRCWPPFTKEQQVFSTLTLIIHTLIGGHQNTIFQTKEQVPFCFSTKRHYNQLQLEKLISHLVLYFLFLDYKNSRINQFVGMTQKETENDINAESKEFSEKIEEVLYTEKDIDSRVRELAAKISKDYTGKELVVVGLLRGAFMFMSDLVKRITVPIEIDFMVLSSYHGTESQGSVCVQKDMQIDPMDKDILIVEDLIDTGNTLAWLCEHLKSKKCKSVRLCTLFNKQTTRRVKHVNVDYVGFNCDDKFIVGYGMDFDQKWRNLPYIAVLKKEVYENIKGH